MTLVYLPSALDDLEWVRAYYAETFPAGSYNAALRFEETERLLIAQPLCGTPYLARLRRRKVTKTPFSLIYRVVEARIEVLRVLDDRAQ